MSSIGGAHLPDAAIPTPEKIVGWLETLALDETAESPVASRQNQDDKQIRSGQELPATPRRHENYEPELSPGETSFASVFSSPQYGSRLCRKRARSASSDTTATTIGEDFPDGCEESNEEFLERAGSVHQLDSISFTSVEPPTECVEVESPALESTNFDTRIQLPAPGEPRLVFVTSCFQCILAKLPCSRTPPACSRCVRAGHGDLCLLHRRKVFEELVEGNGLENQSPELLKVKDDKEEVWEQKLTLFRELYQFWMDSEDRRNWVLPDIKTDRRGRYKEYGKYIERRTHPGEGLGRQTFRTLQLA